MITYLYTYTLLINGLTPSDTEVINKETNIKDTLGNYTHIATYTWAKKLQTFLVESLFALFASLVLGIP